jgi:hypothetical protein
MSNRIAIPIVTCPRCGRRMRLTTVEPEHAAHPRDRMTFECDCGFSYRQSAAVRAEQTL